MILRCVNQLRIVPGAVVGLDLDVCISIGLALGYDAAALAEMLPGAETGMIASLNARYDIQLRRS